MAGSDKIEEAAFSLADGERAHPLWTRLRRHLEYMRDRERERNDRPMSESETANVRGRIKMLKELIRLGDDPPPDATA